MVNFIYLEEITKEIKKNQLRTLNQQRKFLNSSRFQKCAWILQDSKKHLETVLQIVHSSLQSTKMLQKCYKMLDFNEFNSGFEFYIQSVINWLW